MVGAARTEEQWRAEFADARLPQTQLEWFEKRRDVHGDDAPEVFDARS